MTLPYYAAARVVMEIGTGATRLPGVPVTWGSAHWGAAGSIWSGYEPLWVEIECDRAISGASRIGRERSWDDYGIGTLTVEVVNEDGAYTWNPAAAPAGTNAIEPGDPIRLSVEIAGIRHPIARGYVETIAEGYAGLDIVTATLSGQDALAQLNRGQAVPPRAAVGLNEFADQRIARMLNDASWPAAWRLLDHGTVRLQATTFADTYGAEMAAAVEAEGGSMFADRRNRIVFRARSWEYKHATTPKLSFGPDGRDVCPLAYEVARDIDDIANRVIYQRVGGNPQTVSNVESIATYGLRVESTTDLISAVDGDVLTLAQNELARRSAAPVVVRAITFEVWGDDPTLCAKVADLELGDLVTVSYVHPREGWSWVKNLHVQSIAHSLTPDEWTVHLSVDDLGAYAVVDRWNEGRWASAVWS